MPRSTATAEKPAEFNPNDHLTDLKGKDYLGARWRLKWLRTEHPLWSVSTTIVELDWDAGFGIVRAEVHDEEGRLIASAFKSGVRAKFYDFLEKAETGAIGRACAVAGYGTEDAVEMDEEEAIADAPVERKPRSEPTPARQPTPIRPTVPDEPTDEELAELHGEPTDAPWDYAAFRAACKAAPRGAQPDLKALVTTAAKLFPTKGLELHEPKMWQLTDREWRQLAVTLGVIAA